MKGFMYEAYALLEEQDAKNTFLSKHSEDLQLVPVETLVEGDRLFIDELSSLGKVESIIPMDAGREIMLKIGIVIEKTYSDDAVEGSETELLVKPGNELQRFSGDINTVYTPAKSDFNKKLTIISRVMGSYNPTLTDISRVRKIVNSLTMKEKEKVIAKFPALEEILNEH